MTGWGDIPGGFKAVKQGIAPLSGAGGITGQRPGETPKGWNGAAQPCCARHGCDAAVHPSSHRRWERLGGRPLLPMAAATRSSAALVLRRMASEADPDAENESGAKGNAAAQPGFAGGLGRPAAPGGPARPGPPSPRLRLIYRR